MLAELKAEWLRLWGTLDLTGDPLYEFRILVNQYQELGRFYHTLDHIRFGLELFRTAPRYEPITELAWWFHDAIYDTRIGQNEERSANYAYAAGVGMGLSDRAIERLRQLVLCTEHVGYAPDWEARLLCDIDLAILGQSRAVFEVYERNIRREYAWVPDETYYPARNAIIQRLLDRNSIYQTRHFKHRLEGQARQNLLTRNTHGTNPDQGPLPRGR